MDGLHELLYFSGVKPGVLEIVDGDLQYADFINCILRCSQCGQGFELCCEIYHGAGGHFTLTDLPP